MAEQKKRKRSSRVGGDTVTTGTKRQATEKGEPIFGWNEAKQLKTANPPFILEPAGCQIPDDITFHVYTRQRDRADLPDDPTPLDLHEYLLFSNDHPLFEFKAHEDPLTRWTRLYVGYDDPKSGKKEMVQTKKLIVRAVPKDKQPSGPTAGEDGQPANLKASEMALELGRLFGSKRAKRAIAEKERNQITLPGAHPDGSPKKLDRAAAATLDVIGEAGASMATREELQAVIDATKPVPKANLDADDIQDVYDPVELIGTDILNGVWVKDWQDAVKSGEGVDVSSKYVASRINRIAQGPNSTSRLRLLRYTYFLIAYYASSSKKRHTRYALRRKEFQELTQATGTVTIHIHTKFSNRGEINSYHDALLLTHIFAFASILDNFEFDIQYLREDLKIDQEKFAQHFHEIGGRVMQAKELGTGKIVQVARLALPLRFPKQRRIRQARR